MGAHCFLKWTAAHVFVRDQQCSAGRVSEAGLLGKHAGGVRCMCHAGGRALEGRSSAYTTGAMSSSQMWRNRDAVARSPGAECKAMSWSWVSGWEALCQMSCT